MRTRQGGFTLVETTVALGLMALGGLALMATGDYFLKSRLASESRSAHTDLRNLVQTALSQKITTCNPPTVCTSVNQCKTNLNGVVATPPLSVPTAGGTPVPSITSLNNIELAISIGGTPLVTSGKSKDHLDYKVFLTGEFKSQSSTETVYAGAVEIIGKRNSFLRGGDLTARVPLEFRVNNSGVVTDCFTRPTEGVLALFENTLNSCRGAGGMPVPTDYGSFCRFRRPVPIVLGPMPCPDGFLGTPATGCTVDMGPESPFMKVIPPCPLYTGEDNTCGDGEFREAPGVGSCTSCSTPVVPHQSSSTVVSYVSTPHRTASTDCAVSSITGGCAAGYHASGKTCLPGNPGPPTPACNLNASITAFSPPTLASPSGGHFNIVFSGNPSSDNAVTATINVTPASSPPLTVIHFPGQPRFHVSNVQLGNYVITVSDPSNADCTVTIQKTVRIGGFFPDPTLNQGNLFCTFQGFPGGTPAPECPDDPEWDHVLPRIGWELHSYLPGLNRRVCQYTLDCAPPGTLLVIPAPDGDGITPSCFQPPALCPNTDPPTYPAPWTQTSVAPNPLTCKWNASLTTPTAPFECSNYGFNVIPAATLSAHPEVNEWVTDPDHILCY